MSTPDDVRQEIELKVVELLRAKVAEGTMTEERSQAIAKIILELLHPGMSWEELYKAIPKLDDTATELSVIILPYLRDYERMVTGKAKERVTELIATGQYDAAIKLAKNVINQDVQLVWSGEARSSSAGQGAGKPN